MSTSFDFLPAPWNETRGAGVTIALFDTGVDFSHPALAHLDKPGCKFNVAGKDFDPLTADGNDAVPDATFMGNLHGTQTAGVIAAKAMPALGIPEGIAPDVNLMVFKMRDENGESFADYFFKGLQLALRLEVDLIAAPFTPTFKSAPDQQEIDRVFAQLVNAGILLFTTGPNTARLDRLNALQFPANRPEAIVTAVLQEEMLKNWRLNDQLSPGIAQVWPEANSVFCNDPQTAPALNARWRNSHATTALAAIAALRISAWKAAEKMDYSRRLKKDMIAALRDVTAPFVPQKLLTDKSFRIYHLS